MPTTTFIYKRRSKVSAAASSTGSEVITRNNSSFELDGTTYSEVAGSTRGGEGGMGKVREFAVVGLANSECASEQAAPAPSLFVKSSLHCRPAQNIKDAQQEYAYYSRVYPQLNIQLDCGDGDYRLVLPDLGQRLADYAIANIDNALEFRELALAAFQELARIHRLGIIHGDAHDGNIMVLPENRVYFIDGSFYRESSKYHDITFARGKDITSLVAVISDTSARLFGMDVFPQIKNCNNVQDITKYCIGDILALLASDSLSYHPAVFSENAADTMMSFSFPGSSAFTGGVLALKEIRKKNSLLIAQELEQLNKQYLEMQQKELPIHQLIFEIGEAIKGAVDHEELTGDFAKQLCNDTLLLVQGSPDSAAIERYLQLAANIEDAAPCQTYTRRLSKAMVMLGTAMLIAGLAASCFGAPVAIAGGIAMLIFLAATWKTKKGSIQSNIEDIAVSQHPSPAVAAGMRVKHFFS